ncbi:hypothetical protein GCM10027167_08760 [Nocardia heshunensis]
MVMAYSAPALPPITAVWKNSPAQGITETSSHLRHNGPVHSNDLPNVLPKCVATEQISDPTFIRPAILLVGGIYTRILVGSDSASKGKNMSGPFRPAQGPHVTSTVLSELARLWDQATHYALMDNPHGQEISQRKLADQSGVPTQTISSWSTGASLPRDMDRLVAVGAVLARWAGETALSFREWERRLGVDRAAQIEAPRETPLPDNDRSPVTNELSGTVSGNVIQAGQVHGNITFR